MVKAPLYLILVAYISIQLKPLTAVVADVLAHTFWEAQHLAHAHHDHDHHHLEEELSEPDDHDHEHSVPNEKSGQKSGQELQEHITTATHFHFSGFFVITFYGRFCNMLLQACSQAVITPPPELS
ncbi:MAG: hypothetical protein JST26_12145 [Bacteroidetes bacterium]|nr:hypothetical protein [Bacteroidota bacterium]